MVGNDAAQLGVEARDDRRGVWHDARTRSTVPGNSGVVPNPSRVFASLGVVARHVLDDELVHQRVVDLAREQLAEAVFFALRPHERRPDGVDVSPYE